ncbi:MAG TPA: cytochrome P450, partial [Terriglobales bacterium]|nr:cytochrome P450 [Terriglobales bacterium]
QPVMRLSGWFGEENLITRFADVEAILGDPLTFSSQANARGIGLVMGRTLLELDGTAHLQLRKTIAPFFSLRALASRIEPIVRATAAELIDDLSGFEPVDLVAQLTFTYPLRVIARTLGIPIADYASFHHRAIDLISVGDDPPRGLGAAQWLRQYLRPLLDERRAARRDDLLSMLVEARVGDTALTDDEVISFLLLLLPAGAETTYRLLGSTLFALLSHDNALEEVRADRRKLADAIEETLRWESPVQFVSRQTTAPVTIAGTALEAGEILFVAIGSANRDERRFDRPDQFDLHRQRVEHLAFGLGPHYCAGSHLARLETTVAITALLDRFPQLRLDPDQPARIVGLAFRSPDRLPVRLH